MDISLEPGKYVVAVSGGVDSVVSLNMLSMQSDLVLVVAHFDHGIRSDSFVDKEFVSKLAENYGLKFISEDGKLGPNASEELARKHRYDFLHRVAKQYGAKAIVTAHHQDDVIETAIINTLRGTKRKGLSSLKSTDDIKRPLLTMSKQEILEYAQGKGLEWKEDETNKSAKYLRNRIRQRLEKEMTEDQRAEILTKLKSTDELNKKIDRVLSEYVSIDVDGDSLKTASFIALPHDISRELLAEWLRRKKISFDSKSIERIVVSIKTKKPGINIDLDSKHYLEINSGKVGIKPRTSV